MGNPTVVIVPGAWQCPSSFDSVSQTLNERGYETIIVYPPTTVSQATPAPSSADDVAAIRLALKKVAATGKRSLLLVHSAGGLTGSNAIPDHNVVGIIYLSAFVVPAGQTIMDLLGGKALPWMRFEGDRIMPMEDWVADVAFHDLDPEAQAAAIKKLSPVSAYLFAGSSAFEPWKAGPQRVPTGYIFCSEDRALPFPIQQQMASQLGPYAPTYTLDTSHSPHLSVPNRVVDAVEDVHLRLGA